MIQESYVTFEQAKALKELGFPQNISNWSPKYTTISDEPSIGTIEYYSKPSLSLVQKWLLEEKRIYVHVIPLIKTVLSNNIRGFSFNIYTEEDGGLIHNHVEFKTPEQALSQGIDKCIELLKQEGHVDSQR